MPEPKPIHRPDPSGYSAPSHLGGYFDDADYKQSQWHGVFGFAPTDRAR